MRKRPNLYTNYSTENAIFSNSTQKFWFFILTFLAVSLCFVATDYWILLISRSLTFAIGAWGINIVSYGFLKKYFLPRVIFGEPSVITQCSDL